MIDLGIFPHVIDTKSGIFSFSPHHHTEITAENVYALISLEITDLRINNCCFTNEAFAVLCDLIKTSTSLTCLDLSYCRLSNLEFSTLQSNSKLTNVNLTETSIGLNIVLTIFDLVSTGKLTPHIQISPHSFDFSLSSIYFKSQVDTADLCALLKALKSNVPIKRVKCRRLRTFSLKGIFALFEILSINKSVIDLDVSPHCLDIENGIFCFFPRDFTYISAQELSYLHYWFKSCSFKKLIFKQCKLSVSGTSVLCDIIRNCHSLTSVGFISCGMSSTGRLQIINALQSNSCLKMVNLSHNDINMITILAIFNHFSTYHSPPTFEVFPHSIDFSRGIIRYEYQVTSYDLVSLLNVLKSNVPVKRVECRRKSSLNFGAVAALFQQKSINNSWIDVDIAPHFIDTKSAIFSFSPQVRTKITAKNVSALLAFEITDLRINKCPFSNEAFVDLCDLIKTSTSLTCLDLSYCRLSNLDFSTLQSNSKLKNVKLIETSIGFNNVLIIFDLVSTGKLTSNIEISPHSFDFSLGGIYYKSQIDTGDLSTLLKALKSNVPIKCVQCCGIIDLSFDSLVAIFQFYTIYSLKIDFDTSPHFIDVESRIFSFSPQFHTEITADNVSALLSLGITDLRIKKCTFTHEAFSVMCDLIKISNSLTYLDLSYCRLSDVHFLRIIDSFQLNSALNVKELRFEAIFLEIEVQKH
ncbi:hypothetical protein GEMRC1_009976 [Eukaryota sp. GEM-RC1]